MLFALALAAAEPPIVPFDKADFNNLKLFVGVHLKDDSSARWKLAQPLTSAVYCGWVNSKNSFGAFSGWQSFAVAYLKFDDDKARFVYGPFFLGDGSDAAANMYLAQCEAAGFNIHAPPTIPDN